METLEITLYANPFPLMVVENFYNEEELNLIWEELSFYTKPEKLLNAEGYGGIVNYTNAKALILDEIYTKKHRNVSNILTMNRKLFKCGVLDKFSEIHDCCSIANESNYDVTKVRYYHDKEYYEAHADISFQFLGFSYFYKEPKKFTGGELFFPRHNYELTCENNSIIILPGWVKHGVKEIKIGDSNYYDGWGRYAITSFFTNANKKLINESDTI